MKIKNIIRFAGTGIAGLRLKTTRACCCMLCLLFCFSISPVHADTIPLKIVQLADGKHKYFCELLTASLAAVGHTAEITLLPAVSQRRIIHLLETDQISLRWMFRTGERDSRFTPVEVGLSNGLIGQRVLLIPPGKQAIYDSVNSLDGFRNLGMVGAFGKGWYDVEVWDANKLPKVIQDGEWRNIYNMLAAGNRGIDYFSRGIIEICDEARLHPNVAIEKRLLFIYEGDYCFYLSRSSAQYKRTLESALRKAQKNGLMQQLINKYWADDFEMLQPAKRTVLRLKNP